MIKLLIGGSPCTYWSIAQKNNRETKAEGLGWELFKNYLIAKEKFKPDFFLYENNKSASQAIKDQIKKELKVWDGTLFMEDSGARYIEINSALVSAQNRQRFYVHNCGEVEQPEDRGILLRDILESGQRIPPYGNEDKSRPVNALYPNNAGLSIEKRIYSDNPNKQQIDFIAEPIGATNGGKALCLCARYNGSTPKHTIEKSMGTMVAEPVENVGNCETIQKAIPKLIDKYGYLPEQFNAYNLAEITDKSPTLSTGSMVTSSCVTTIFEKTNKHLYEVKDGKITIKGKQYPIKLADGFYIIRKLTVTECCRLQTMPDDYCRAVAPGQAYKGLGNGWTAEVIIHILNGALKSVPKDEEIIVLSMYDGIGTGRYCLDKMGFTNVKYYAYEIDKYAKQIAMSNYPDIIQMGDAFDLRKDEWRLY